MGSVYWITGLSGAGKSTLCRLFVEWLRNNGRMVVMLDGDDLREVMGKTNVHTREKRLELAMAYSRLCKLISLQGFDVAIATISMFREVHSWNRENLPEYFEIFLDVPIAELKRRDKKGIYQGLVDGILANVAGVDCSIDLPKSPDLYIGWEEGQSIGDNLELIQRAVSARFPDLIV